MFVNKKFKNFFSWFKNLYFFPDASRNFSNELSLSIVEGTGKSPLGPDEADVTSSSRYPLLCSTLQLYFFGSEFTGPAPGYSIPDGDSLENRPSK
jgi:hypothetical protein